MTQHLLLHLFLYWASVFYWDSKNGIPVRAAVAHAPRVLINQMLVVLPSIFYATTLPGCIRHSPLSEAARITCAVLIGEFAVYYVHLALHKYRSIRWLHMLHHEPLTSAAQTLDSSAGEVLVLNILAPFLPFVLFGCLRTTVLSAIHLGTIHAVATHSRGLRILGQPYNHHEMHHLYPLTNYSTFGFADWIMGTQ